MNPTDPSLSQQVAELAARVSRLEAAAQPEQARAAARPDAEPDALWALTALRSQRADHPATADGIVMIVGSVTLPDGTPVAWQEGAATADLFEQDWTDHAAAFAALGHPVRLELMRHIMSGVHATAELAEIASLGTTGQLHHHLRQLVAAGWVRQSGRGSYEVPAARIVPMLTSLLGAPR